MGPAIRETWSRSVEYLLAIAGYAVGLGNVWRFPYLCYRSGGGAFLIPFFLMLGLCGVPLCYMEMAVGQYTQQGPVGAIGKLCPFFKGAGLATVVISFLFTTYYNVIITYAFYYLFSSFTSSELPWASCDNDWNSPACYDAQAIKGDNSSVVAVRPNGSLSPSEDFFERRLLEKSSGIDSPGVLQWDLTLILLLCWVLVYFCIFKGPKLTGKVVYFTATFPYLVLTILLVFGLTLPGAWKGIRWFIVPRWELLLDANVWVNAAAQTFNSIGIAFGGIITMSSYNKPKNKILKDVLILSVVDALTCLLAGFAIFSILGFLAHSQDTEVETVIKEGPGLVFIIYPAAFASMPAPQVFSVLFFFMLICLGIDSQFASVEVVVTTINDHFGASVKKFLKRKEILVLVVCCVSFLCGLPNVTQGGIYFFQLIDYFAAALSLMYLAFFEVIAITWFYEFSVSSHGFMSQLVSVIYLAFFEVIAITWFYGTCARKLAQNVEDMTGQRPPLFFVICWFTISPILIFGIWMFSLVQYTPFSMAGYTYPGWALGLGWFIALASIICIPAGMVHSVATASGSNLWQKFKTSLRPTINHSLGCEKHENGATCMDTVFPIDDVTVVPLTGSEAKNGSAVKNGLYPQLHEEENLLNGHNHNSRPV